MYGSSVFRLARTSNVRNYKSDTKKLLGFLADMPKVNTARITEAQQQRQRISKLGEKNPSKVYLQVIGSGARGVPNAFYLFTDYKRYLFNCGESTQRLAYEHKVKLSRLEHVFITSKTWKNIGGLPGLSLTLQDIGIPKITLHGPNGLDDLYNATKRFVVMKEMQVTMAPTSPTEDFEDSVMTIKYVHLSPQVSLLQDIPPKPSKRARLSEVSSPVYDQFSHDHTDYYNRDPDGESKTPKPRSSRSPDKRQDKLHSRRHEGEKSPNVRNRGILFTLDQREKKMASSDLVGQHTSVAYICTLKKRLGTLDLAKCVEKKVPPGPLLGQLKSGIDVVLADGTIVMSKDVKSPDDPGPVFIVLEVPDITYLNETEFTAHFDNGINSQENIPTLIVHMSPPEVFHHKDYKAFMAKFGPTTRHLILNSQNSCLGSEAVHRTQHKLHLLNPEVFPLLKDTSIPAEWGTHPPIPKTNSPNKMKGFEDLKNRIAMAQFQNIINMEAPAKDAPDEDENAKVECYSSRTLTIFHLRPKRQIDRSTEPKLHIQEYYQEVMDVDGFVASLDKFRGEVHNVRYANNDSSMEYPKIVFLGTGSCIPSKTRNTSAIIVHVDDQSTILLDCGEGTFGQLVRFYGPRKVDEVLRTLKAIYISHLHADHHIGLIGVLQARAAAFAIAPEKNVPVLLLAPGQIITWLTMYDTQFEKIASEFTLIPNQSLLDSKEPGLTPAALASISLDAVLTCLVPHCPNAFGVALTVAGHKITYSGDTLPTENLVKIGQNSTVLIHEATMEDELVDEARVKMHSTTSQAIEIGRKMNAKYTVLTHFSQRYARLPRLNAHILNDNNTVGIAFDNMQVTLSDFPFLPHMYAPLQLMFAEHCVGMELKAASRVRRKDKTSSSSISDKRRPGRRRSRGGIGSRNSSATRSLTHHDSDRDRSKSGEMKDDSFKTAGKSSNVRKKNGDSKGNVIPKKNIVPPPRYKENLTARLRRQSSVISSITASPRRASSVASRRTASSFTAPSSKSVTPRCPSPQPSAPVSSTEKPPSNASEQSKGANKLSEHAQDLLKDMSNSNGPSCTFITRNRPTRTASESKTNRKIPEIPKPNLSNRPSVCKAFVLVKSRDGYGQPLLKSTNKKLVIRPYPVPSYTTHKTMDGAPSCARVTSGSGAISDNNCGRCPRRDFTPKSSNVRFSQSPVKKGQSSYNLDSTSKSDYKPRLSDIESSYYIMKQTPENIKSGDSSLCGSIPQASTKKDRTREAIINARIRFLRRTQQYEEVVSQKPEPLREDVRQMMLRQSRKKFQSKQYQCQSKFDKIEGLNWISWPQ